MFRKSNLIQHNLRLGLEYMTLAAHQGHIGAMYALAVVHVEGYESYHSCTLSEKLFKAVLERGNTSRLIQSGYANYLEGRPDRAAMYYAEAGILGNEVGQINGAILHDKHQLLPADATLRATLRESKLLSDYLIARQLSEDDLYDLVFEDLLGLGIQLNRDLTNSNATRLSEIVATRLYQTAARDKNTFAAVRLGDFYYYGKGYFASNVTKAFALYNESKTMNKSVDFQAQAYLSTGFMHQFGIGVARSLGQAREDYEKAKALGGNLSYIAMFAKLLLELEYIFNIDFELVLSGDYQLVAWRLLHNLQVTLRSGLVLNPVTLALGLLAFLAVLRVRLVNQIASLDEQADY